MKVALCLSGQARTFDKCWPSIKKHLVDPFDSDVFCNVCSDKDIYKVFPYVGEFTQLNITRDIDIFVPFEYRQLLGDKGLNRKVIQQLLYVFRCNEDKRKYEKYIGQRYDIVIRSRMDLYFEDGIESQIEKGIYFPRFANEGGYTDRFAFGPSNIMDVYSDRINTLCDNSPLTWNPEQDLKNFIDVSIQIPNFKSDVVFYRLVEKDGEYFTKISDLIADFDDGGRGIYLGCRNVLLLDDEGKIQSETQNDFVKVSLNEFTKNSESGRCCI